MSKWWQWEEQLVYGTDENTPSISRCHQVSRKHSWSSQVYQAIISLTSICPNAQVALLAGEIMITTMKVTIFSWKENFQGATICDHALPITHLDD